MKFTKGHYVATVASFCLACLLSASLPRGSVKAFGQDEELGRYFSKKQYVPSSLPKYEDVKAQLPSPMYDDNPLLVETYWKAWELAFKNFHEPSPRSGFVSQFIDAAFNENIFMWDSSFMTMFCNFASPLVPGISTLDNFYAKQHEDGEIGREIVRDTGVDFWVNVKGQPLFSKGLDSQMTHIMPYIGRAIPTPNPKLLLDGLDHPIMAWAELESYRVTGNTERLTAVWEPLVHYYGALQKYIQQGNGLYMTDWASMDNSPRNDYLNGRGTAVDISAEMALFARQMAEIARILGKPQEARQFSRDAATISKNINHLMWDKDRKFYFDLKPDNRRAPVKTVAAYWTLIAHVAPADHAKDLVAELKNPRTFGRLNAVPTLAADQTGYDPSGGYWEGSVWAPTTTMVIRGLEAYGYDELAREMAMQHLKLVANVYKKTGTIWENYAPDFERPGSPAKPDFVGWSGIGPIMYLLEYGIGLKPNAEHNELVWDLKSGGRRGCDHFRFNGHVVSLVAERVPDHAGKLRITVESDGDFRLKILVHGSRKTFSVTKGKQEFIVGS